MPLPSTSTVSLIPVGFENFVWLTPDEIAVAIRAKFPLFSGYLPENSPHQDEIKAALTAALAAKSNSADVVYDTFEPTLRHPVRMIGFQVTKPRVRVANIHLSGVTPALVPLVQKSVNATARTPYNEGPGDSTTADLILAPLLDAGYAQATLTDAIPVPAAIENGNEPVVVNAKLQSGEVFHVSTIAFAGVPLLSAEAFTAAAKLLRRLSPSTPLTVARATWT